MKRSITDTALLLAVMLERTGKTRARFSQVTVQRASNSKRLTSSRALRVAASLEEYGWVMTQIESGGYGAIKIKALESARAVTPESVALDSLLDKKPLTPELRESLEREVETNELKDPDEEV